MIDNDKAFEILWWNWWNTLQPDWRKYDADRYPKHEKARDFYSYSCAGKNGLLSPIAALCWWRLAVGNNGVVDGWFCAVKEVVYILKHI
jgi:hypothetical protein